MKRVMTSIFSLVAMLAVDVSVFAANNPAQGFGMPPSKRFPSATQTHSNKRIMPIIGNSEHSGITKDAALAQSPIAYHGGPVMTQGANVYYIWYGNWSSNSAVGILTDFMNSVGGSSWLNIETTYYQTSSGVKTPIKNLVTLKKSIFDNYSKGKVLTDSAVSAIVKNAITSGKLPLDPNGVYFVLTSSDVSETSGFCTQYCGWHDYMFVNAKKIPYSFIGNAARCLNACAPQTTSPNGNAGADAMASVIAHELAEIMSDPYLNAWYDAYGEENADKCSWTFGSTYGTQNGSQANVKLGSRNYLIQQNWVNSSPSGKCSMHYP